MRRFLLPILISVLSYPVTSCGAGDPTEPRDTSEGEPVGIQVTWASVSAGWEGGYFGNTCALTVDGVAYCWGDNSLNQLGSDTTVAFGPGGKGGVSRPIPVSGNLRFSQLTLGWKHSCGVTPQGEAYCWGDKYRLGNTAFQHCSVGNCNPPGNSEPLRVSTDLLFDTIVAWEDTCGLTQRGATYCWRQTAPVVLPAPTFVHLGGQCGITAGGFAYCWGFNSQGEVGDGTTTSRDTPVPVTGGLTFKAISMGDVRPSTCALTDNGTAYCWGYPYSAGGRGYFPQRIPGDHAFTAITTGYDFACALGSGGAAYCWGSGQNGQLGTGSRERVAEPVLVSGGHTFKAITAGSNHACGLTPDGAIYCWGSNGQGQLGDGSFEDRLSPVKVMNPLR